MFCSLIKIKKSSHKKVYLNRDIFNIVIEYLIIDLYNESLNINNLKILIETNIKLNYIFNDIKYENNVRNFCRILKLLEKYNYYNKDYEYYIGNKLVDNKKYQEHPILIDALFSGCDLPLAYSSHKYFTDEIFSDIREIIYLIPRTINSDWGYIRCRNGITPLFAACINTDVPLKAIEFLLSKGANKNHNISVNGEKTDILSDLEDNISSIGNHRYEQIKKIFRKYK